MLCNIWYLSKLIWNPNLVKSHSPITYLLVIQSIWNFAQSLSVILPCPVPNFNGCYGRTRFEFKLTFGWISYIVQHPSIAMANPYHCVLHMHKIHLKYCHTTLQQTTLYIWRQITFCATKCQGIIWPCWIKSAGNSQGLTFMWNIPREHILSSFDKVSVSLAIQTMMANSSGRHTIMRISCDVYKTKIRQILLDPEPLRYY